MSADGKWVVTILEHNLNNKKSAKLVVIDWSAKKIVWAESSFSVISCLALSQDGKTLATGMFNRCVYLRDFEAMKKGGTAE